MHDWGSNNEYYGFVFVFVFVIMIMHQSVMDKESVTPAACAWKWHGTRCTLLLNSYILYIILFWFWTLSWLFEAHNLTAFWSFGLNLAMALKHKAKNKMHLLKAKRQKLGFGTYTNTTESWPSKLRWFCTWYFLSVPFFYSYVLCLSSLSLSSHITFCFSPLLLYQCFTLFFILPHTFLSFLFNYGIVFVYIILGRNC